MAVHRLTIPTGGGRLAAALHLPEAGQRPWPCVVTAHGLLSSKDSDKYVQIGEVFTQAGIAVCRFDFRGCGESQGNLAETTVAQRVADLRAVVEMMRAHPALSGRVALLGSSLGGYVALFAASRISRSRRWRPGPPRRTWTILPSIRKRSVHRVWETPSSPK